MVRRIKKSEREFRENLNDKLKEEIEEFSVLWWDIWDLINEMVKKTHNRSWK